MFALSLFILTLIQTSQSIILGAPNGFKAGLIIPFTTYSQQNQTINYTAPYNDSFVDPVRAAGISLIGFQGLVSSSFYYLPQISTFNISSISISIVLKIQTYLTRLSFNYIVIGDPISGIYLDLFTGCFLCANLSSGNGDRIQTFGIHQHSRMNTGQMVISTSVYGFNISTMDGNAFKFQTQTWMQNNSKTIYQRVSALDDTLISIMCLTTIIYDKTAGDLASSYTILVKNVSGIVDFSTQATNIPTFSIFQDANLMFFGIAGMNLGLVQSQEQDLYIETDSYSDLNVNFTASASIINLTVNAFYIVEKICPASNYYNPQTYSCVVTCTPPLYGILPEYYCERCHQLCLSCNGTSSNQCITCNPSQNRLINSGTHTCNCQAQFYQINQPICSSCNTMISGCQTCLNSSYCDTCVSPLTVNTVTGQCECANNQYLVSNICIPYPGCLIARKASNALYCDQCDSSLNFIRLTNNFTCACVNNFTLVNGTCDAVCGDGILSGAECDDKNLINGDGCSSTCTIQTGWQCYYNTTLVKSVCTINANFSLEYLYSSRNIEANIGYLYFLLTPSFESLQSMDFSKFCNFSFPYQSLKASYSSLNSILTVKINYLKTIQDKLWTFDLSFDGNIVSSSKVSLAFSPVGRNSLLTYDSYSQYNMFIIYGSLILSVLMWLTVILGSILGQNMLSFQLMLPFQTIYLFLVCTDCKVSNLVGLQFLKFSFGYNNLSGVVQANQNIYTNQNFIFSQQYLQNYNFMILLNLGILLCLIITKLIEIFKYRKVKKHKIKVNQLKSSNKADKTYVSPEMQVIALKYSEVLASYRSFRDCTSLALNRFLIVILSGSLLLSTFNIGFVIGQKYPQNYTFSKQVNYIASSIGILLSSIIMILVTETDNNFSNQIKFQPLEQIQPMFGKLFIIFYIVQVTLLVVVYLTNVPALIGLNFLISVILLVYYIVKNPYVIFSSFILRYGAIVTQILFIIPLILLCLAKTLPMMQEIFYLGMAMVILGCCFLGLILTLIRIIKHYNISKEDIHKQTQHNNQIEQTKQIKLKLDFQDETDSLGTPDAIKNRLLTLKSNGQIINWEERHLQQYESIKMEKEETHESIKKQEKSDNQTHQTSDEEDLALIKKKLRADLKGRRGNY